MTQGNLDEFHCFNIPGGFLVHSQDSLRLDSLPFPFAVQVCTELLFWGPVGDVVVFGLANWAHSSSKSMSVSPCPGLSRIEGCFDELGLD
jgi:hypothetical protein